MLPYRKKKHGEWEKKYSGEKVGDVTRKILLKKSES